MYIAYPNGTIAHKLNANDFLDRPPNILEDGWVELAFLLSSFVCVYWWWCYEKSRKNLSF